MVDKVRPSGTGLTYKGAVWTGWGIAFGSGWQTPSAGFIRKESLFRISHEAGMKFVVISVNPFSVILSECLVDGN